MISAIGAGIGLICLGVFTQLKQSGHELNGFGLFPVASFSFTIFICNLGIVSLPFLVISEIMPEKVGDLYFVMYSNLQLCSQFFFQIRSFATTSCMSLMFILGIFLIKTFPLMTVIFGLHGCLYIFAGFSFAGGIFIIFFLPETKGKSFEEIMRILEK